MSRIQIKDKHFVLSIEEKEIVGAISGMAKQMNEELKDKQPLFICVLNGAFMFASDLLKQLEFPCEVTFIRLKSYDGTSTAGEVKEVHGLIEDVEDRNVVILEDIIDTGYTIENLQQYLLAKKPRSVKVASLLFKPKALIRDVTPDYVALEIPNDFIVGYGLDYDGYGRNLKDIYRVEG